MVLDGSSDKRSRSGDVAASGAATHIPLPSVVTCNVIEDPSVMRWTISWGCGLASSFMRHGKTRSPPALRTLEDNRAPMLSCLARDIRRRGTQTRLPLTVERSRTTRGMLGPR